MKNSRSVQSFFFLVVCCLVFLLAACGSTPVVQANHPTNGNSTVVVQKHVQTPEGTPSTGNSTAVTQKHVQTPEGNTPSQVTTVPVPPTQTTCPADGTARAAVLRTLALGSHPSLVYIYNDVPQNTTIAYGILKRYDVTTGQKKEIVTSGLSIENAQVSADGQWVLFVSQIDPRGDRLHSMALQLVRMDGQGLQTLYCSASTTSITSVQWSTDQKSILLETLDQGSASDAIRLIEVATGALHTELQTPTGADSYTLLTWLDNTRAYVIRGFETQATIPPVLYLLDITTNKDIHGGDLKKVAKFNTSGTTGLSGNSADSSYDAKTLFISSCRADWTSTITRQPATGGGQQTIYNKLQGCISSLRAISRSNLLYVTHVLGGDFGKELVVTAKINGTGSTPLYDNGGTHTLVELNHYTQFPWSNVSRDGSIYAFDQRGVMGNGIGLFFASLSGGRATEFTSTLTGSVFIAGWTMM